MKIEFTILLGGGVAFALAFAALAELLAAMLIPFWVYAAYGAGCALVLAPIVLFNRSRLNIGIMAVLFVGLLFLYAAPWHTRKPFLRDFAKLEIGMTRDEVLAIMDGYMTGTNLPPIPGAPPEGGTMSVLGSDMVLELETTPEGAIGVKDSIVFRHSDKAAFNADWGVVRFVDGRVIETEFLPD